MSNKQVFDELIVQCVTELFRARNIELEPGPEQTSPIEYAAIIGFASDEVRGMLGLGMQESSLQKFALKTTTLPNCEDWLGESVNQLLGRFKNKLMGYNVTVSLALPTVLRGIQLHFLATGTAGLWTYSFESESGSVCAWLDVRHAPNFVLGPTSDPKMQGAPEGELLLF
jgi:hypothetical protein